MVPKSPIPRPVTPPVAQQRDPLERVIPLAFKLLLFLFTAIYGYQAAVNFLDYQPGKEWPFLLWLIRNNIFLYIHEGGHALFMFFGKVLHALGGSFWQVMFPVLSFLIALRKKSTVVAPFALFWAGANMLDVSLYMRDAPVRVLPLLGPRSGHDWFYLFNRFGIFDSAVLVADITYYTGLLICIGSITAGVALAVRKFLEPVSVPQPPSVARRTSAQATPERSLQSALSRKKDDDPFGGI
jgi:hypothetical protein